MIADVDGRRRRKHERSVVGLIGVGIVVVGGGDVDARTPLQRREERRCHMGPDPAHRPAKLLVRQARALVVHVLMNFADFLVFKVPSLLCE